MDSVSEILGGVVLAVAFLYALVRALQRSEDPRALLIRWVLTIVLLTGMVVFARKTLGGSGGGFVGGAGLAMFIVGTLTAGAIALSLIWGRSWIEMATRPLTGLFEGDTQEAVPVPTYSSAEAWRKKGRTDLAIAHVQAQIARFPGDFEGTLLLARIMAEDQQDVSGAEGLLRRWIQEHSADAEHQGVALSQLADWWLRGGLDVARARDLLGEIVARFPGSSAAGLANQRLAHLETELAPARGPIPVPEVVRPEWEVAGPRSLPEPDSASETEDLVRHLESYPADTAARERLAWLYGFRHHQVAMARAELEHLIAERGGTVRQRAHWLNQLADVEVQVAKDLGAARLALERVVELNPRAATAEQARNRLALLALELKRHVVPRFIPPGGGSGFP